MAQVKKKMLLTLTSLKTSHKWGLTTIILGNQSPILSDRDSDGSGEASECKWQKNLGEWSH